MSDGIFSPTVVQHMRVSKVIRFAQRIHSRTAGWGTSASEQMLCHGYIFMPSEGLCTVGFSLSACATEVVYGVSSGCFFGDGICSLELFVPSIHRAMLFGSEFTVPHRNDAGSLVPAKNISPKIDYLTSPFTIVTACHHTTTKINLGKTKTAHVLSRHADTR